MEPLVLLSDLKDHWDQVEFVWNLPFQHSFMKPHHWEITRAHRKEQRLGWVVIHHASTPQRESVKVAHRHTHLLFVFRDCQLWEYPRRWLNWQQQTLLEGSASIPISKETRCFALPIFQDLYPSRLAQRDTLFVLVSFRTKKKKINWR